ncbi:TRAP transporter large permease [Stutzerimonas stutzeri]|uniref:TRAP transporter large permease protein n=1 Tax=Stutzerimonas stutzeri TaxID=316 RepID=A0A6I6LXP0_STUST|nr:TRAP transporter large permease [Stutzerimonas stutzeri]QGZ31131.1 TRAP transporter large permease subunit [Stutzerimonas stutzeri]
MTSIQIGLSCILLLAALLSLRLPIGVSLGVSAFTGIFILRGSNAAFSLMGSTTFDFIAHWSLTAIPMFILMGSIAFHTGLTRTLYDAGRACLGFLPGGLAIATNVSSAGFAAASGSSVAMAGAMSRIAVPEMLRAKYDPGLATGVVAASGTLGAFIPPSIPFVLYAVFMEASVGQLLLAGIIPGLLTMVMYSALIVIRVKCNPGLAPATDEEYSRSEKVRLLLKSWPLPFIVAVVVGGLYTGTVTATEAGAFGAFIAILASVAQRTFTLAAMKDAIAETVKSSATIFLIALGAVLFSRMLTLSQIPMTIGLWVENYALALWVFLIFVTIFYIVLGMFLDPIGLMLVTLPVLAPFVIAFDINVIWFGVLVVKFIEIGLLTPPIGLNLFVVSAGVGDAVPFATIVRGTLWFLAAEAVVLALLMFFPQLSLFLPSLMY